jgi:polysaccharide pyruvyl transferase WcaK-like protein
MLVALCRKANTILIRDHATAAHLSELGIEGARVVGCPVPFLEVDQSADRDPALAGSILLSVREPRLMSIPFSAQGRMYSAIRQIIDGFRKHGDVRLLCHDYQDLRFARAFPDVSMMYAEDARVFLHWLRSCSLNITFRLHAFLSCLALGTPSIPLTYDERSISLVETLGLGEWPVDYIHCPNLMAGLEDRWSRLDRLEEIKRLARPVWRDLQSAMQDGLQRFALQVEESSAARVL